MCPYFIKLYINSCQAFTIHDHCYPWFFLQHGYHVINVNLEKCWKLEKNISWIDWKSKSANKALWYKVTIRFKKAEYCTICVALKMDEETYSARMVPPKTLSPILLKRKKVFRPVLHKWLSGVNVPGSIRLWRNFQVSAECAVLGYLLVCSVFGSRYQVLYHDFDEDSIWVNSLTVKAFCVRGIVATSKHIFMINCFAIRIGSIWVKIRT